MSYPVAPRVRCVDQAAQVRIGHGQPDEEHRGIAKVVDDLRDGPFEGAERQAMILILRKHKGCRRRVGRSGQIPMRVHYGELLRMSAVTANRLRVNVDPFQLLFKKPIKVKRDRRLDPATLLFTAGYQPRNARQGR